ncbi:MAG: hypothetical protein WCI18_14995 [Pseudomonadota bacterium]
MSYIISLVFFFGWNSLGFSSTLRHCMVAKGNGISWASTLGWMSESLAIKAKEASAMEAEYGEPMHVGLNCFAGGSSGSAAAILYQGLLGNQSLTSDRIEDLRSPAELARLSKALRFLAIATDFSSQERNLMAYKGIKFFLKKGPVDEVHKGWWERYALEEEDVLSLLGKYAVVARFLTEEDLNQSLLPILPERLRNFAWIHGLQTLTDLPERGPLGKPLTLEDKINFREFFRLQGKKINELADRIYREHGGETYLWHTFFQEPLADGFCLGAMIEFHENGLVSKNLPGYDRLRPLFMCNAKTIATLRNSPGYPRYMAEHSFFARRSIYATPQTLKDVLRTSIREYQLFKVQLESFKEAGLSHGIDEKDGFPLNTEAELKRAQFGNVGGWVPETIMALPLMWYLEGLDGPDVKLNSLAVFGFLGDGSVGQFSDIWLIRSILGGTPKETPIGRESPLVKSWLKDYKSFQNVLENLKPSLGFLGDRFQIRHTKTNWNLPILAPSYIGRGVKLLATAINQTRQWEGRKGGSNPILFSKWMQTCLAPESSDPGYCHSTEELFAYYSSVKPLVYVPGELKTNQTDIPWWETLGL